MPSSAARGKAKKPTPRPASLRGAAKEFTQVELEWICSQFQVDAFRSIESFKDRGNINLNTYEVVDSLGQTYLLQRLNTEVFRRPMRVMSSMQAWIEAQRSYLASGKAPDWTIWEPITLVPTLEDTHWLDLSDESGSSVWRLMRKIEKSVTYKSLSELPDPKQRLALAEEVGRGLALSADLSSPIEANGLSPTLPGYRDTKGYFKQFHSVLAGHRTAKQAAQFLPEDEDVREATESLYVVHLSPEEFMRRRNDQGLRIYIDWVLSQERRANKIFEAVESGLIRRTAIHGDTKIDNFLFCSETGKVRSLVDLDTIMPYTWLADWGDMVRSLCNVAGEKERDLSRVTVNLDIYEAVTRGFLQTTREVTFAEVELMDEAVSTIALELGLRFLTDYLRGDLYFGLQEDDAPDLNKVRAMVQLVLHKELLEVEPWCATCIRKYSPHHKAGQE